MNSALLANALVHTFTNTEPVVIPLDYLGELGPGAYNVTLRTTPPIPPLPELEQGVGRAPVNAWASQEHVIHDNPDWYLGVGAIFQPYDPSGGGQGAVTQSPTPIQTLIALDYYQNFQAVNAPGVNIPVTVLPGHAITETRRSVL